MNDMNRTSAETATGRGAAGTGGGAAAGGFGVFAQLTRALRHADSIEALRFSIVNETRRLVNYRQASLLLDRGDGVWRVEALSGIPVVERQAPMVRWLEQVAATVRAGPAAPGQIRPLDPSGQGALGALLAEGRGAFGVVYPLWCPLVAPGGQPLGVLWLDRPEPWREPEALLAGELVDAQAHALLALSGGHRRPSWRRPAVWLALAAVVLALLALPARRAALAPVEIVPRDPEVVAAPIDGVVRTFQVRPNQTVAAGDPLFVLDDTDRRAKADVAEKALEIARGEYRQASQGALGGRRDAPKLASLEAQIALKEVELENARQQLDRTQARAGTPGIAIMPDPQEWIGRPVTTGERVMVIADPAKTEARAWLGVRDVLPLEPGAPVRLFLDADPLSPVDGRVVRAGHDAEEVPGGALAYRVTVALDPAAAGRAALRIGLKGTARIEGDRVPLFLYLFRRPISALRQAIGY